MGRGRTHHFLPTDNAGRSMQALHTDRTGLPSYLSPLPISHLQVSSISHIFAYHRLVPNGLPNISLLTGHLSSSFRKLICCVLAFVQWTPMA